MRHPCTYVWRPESIVIPEMHVHVCLSCVSKSEDNKYESALSFLHVDFGIELMSSILLCSPTWPGPHVAQASLKLMILLLIPFQS